MKGAKNTRSNIKYIKMKLHEPSFSVDFQIKVFTQRNLLISIPNYAMFARPTTTGKGHLQLQVTINTSGTASKLCHRYYVT